MLPRGKLSFWSLVGLAVISSLLLFNLDISYYTQYLVRDAGDVEASPTNEIQTLAPTPTPLPKFSILSEEDSTMIKMRPLVQTLQQLGWEQHYNVSQSKLIILPNEQNLFKVRQLNPLAFVNVVNSNCLWGQHKLASLQAYAAITRCNASFFISSQFGNAKTDDKRVTMFIRSVSPWRVYLVGNDTEVLLLSLQAKRTVQFVMQAIQSSLKDDVYRGENMFQVIDLFLSPHEHLLVNIKPNIYPNAQVWEAILSGTTMLLPLDFLEEKIRCRIVDVFPKRFPLTTSCDPSMVQFGSQYSCSTLAEINPEVSNAEGSVCGLAQVSSLVTRHNMAVSHSSFAEPLQCSRTSPELTWQQANEFCQRAGARLCTLDEVNQGVVSARSQCRGDYHRTWTATRCSNEPLAFWTAMNRNRYGDKTPPICQPAAATFAKPLTARCCADSTPPTCLREFDVQVFRPGDPFYPCTEAMRQTTTRSALSCNELLFKFLPATTGERFCFQRTECKTREYTSFCKAKAYCQDLGARLCTAQEHAAIMSTVPASKCDVWVQQQGETMCPPHTNLADKKRQFCCADEVGKYCDLLDSY